MLEAKNYTAMAEKFPCQRRIPGISLATASLSATNLLNLR